ncbi:MAG: ABC transporter ATP-binding protein [Clostridia bacterium]|nr:ABC transporter ATP-binding protein [Clostridia bacterium]
MKRIVYKNDSKTLRKAFYYIGRNKFFLPISIVLALISVGLNLYIPMLIGNALDLMIEQGNVDMEGVLSILSLALILVLVNAILQWGMGIINSIVAQKISEDVRNEAFDRLERLPLSYIDRTAHGDIVNRVINDTDRFSEGLFLGFTQVFTGILTIIGTLCFMLTIDWKIAIVVVLLTPISILVARFIGKRTYSMFKERSEDEAAQATHINEIIGNQKIVRAFGREDETLSDFDVISTKLEKSSLKAIFFSSLVNPTTRFVNNIVYAAVALVGALTVLLGKMLPVEAALLTVGEFTVLLSYTNQYTKPFNEISGIIAEFQNALASAARVFELIEEPVESPDSENARVIKQADGKVLLSNVEFSYDKTKSLIRNLNLDVKPGQRVAIVGPTGCGKTTVINLLMRFYDVDAGEIRVDGTDIRNVTRKSLRASYGMVLQDTWVMSGSVRENIAFGNPDATDEQIVSAAKAAHAHSFIKRLKNGYDTKIGEGGEELSQGQKQLICIARVMLSLPPMLILDEATSSIDTRTEMKIQEAFAAMMEGRTSFIVAHRLSTIREADVILVMRDGRIIETGTHNKLLNKGGFYSELYNSQFAH